MKISLGTAIYNHKPTEADMIWRSGFLTPRKKPTLCPVREDTVENYAFAYDNGICVKGYMFKSWDDIWKRTFVCDFDNLTEEQYKQVIEIIGNGKLKRIQGRMSSGMKTEMFQNEGIPNWKPARWKYKVFFPLDEFYGNRGVMCIREEIERAYLDVVQFFNPWSDKKTTEEIARMWLKANNQSMYYKHGKKKGQVRNNHPSIVIEDPMFKDYILPDPVEVTNPRHQITYSVIPQMKEEHRFLQDEDWEKIFGSSFVGRFPATTKGKFTEIINLPYDFKNSLEHYERISDKKFYSDPEFLRKLASLVGKALSFPENGNRKIPTSKSEMARKTGKSKWDDLVFDKKLAAKTNVAIYSEWEHGYDRQKVSEMLCDICRFLVRCQAETYLGTCVELKKETIINDLLEDLPWYASHVFGENFFQSMDEKNKDGLVKSVSLAIEKACFKFKVWRLSQKCLMVVEKSHTELMDEWKAARMELGNTADFETYFKEKARIENEVVEEARNTQFPYIYVRRGVKKEMIERALNTGRPMSKEMFIGFVIEQVSESDGMIEEEQIGKWYREYQSSFNKTQRMELGNDEIYGQMTGYQLTRDGKVRKERKSRYDELFNGKTKEEIADIISNMNISRGRKSQLRRDWGCLGLFVN